MGHKEDFFEFTYLQKVKNIIDEASVNEYVKNKEVTKIWKGMQSVKVFLLVL